VTGRVVELVPGRAQVGELSGCDVLLDGVRLGRVARVPIERERRTPGRRYVNARWYSPGWKCYPADGSWAPEAQSRRDGVERLLEDAGVPYREALDLAATTAHVRVRPAEKP